MNFFKNILNLEKDTIGLDIGQRAIKLVALKKSGSKINLLSYSKVPIDFPIFGQSNLLNKTDLVEKIKEAITAAKPNRLNRKNVVVSLPESKVFLKIIKIPGNLSENELKNAIFWQAKQEIPLKPSEAEFSYVPISQTEKEIEVLLVAAPKSLLEDYLDIVRKADLELVAVEIDPIAQSRALISNEDKDKTVLICDIALKNIGLVLWSKGSVRISGSILMGEEDLYGFLKEVFSEDEIAKFKNVEELYKKFSKKFEEAFQRPFSQIQQEIEKITSFYQRETGNKLDKIILAGGGSDFPYLKSYLRQAFKKTIQMANPQFAYPTLNLSPIASKDIPVFTTAIGLALREFDYEKD